MSKQALLEHLATGQTRTCHCWQITRTDGVVMGFTDHDLPLTFDGVTFEADSGLSARALSSATGLSVDNTEAVGMLNNASITEADIDAGRYDGAEVKTWLVRWDKVNHRALRFFGKIGEITRGSGGFQADLRGLSDLLNQPQGRSYLRSCSAVLGDAECGFDVSDPSFTTTVAVQDVKNDQYFRSSNINGFNAGWFESGTMTVMSGAAKGLSAVIKNDRKQGNRRHIDLWQPFRASVASGDQIKLVAGCDKRAETCRVKFDNMLNFRGFPDIPGDDWNVSVPRSDDNSDGGSLR